MILLAIDPGIRGCGVALFENAKLCAVDYVRNPKTSGNKAEEVRAMATAVGHWAPCVDQLALEWPRVYATSIRAGRSKEDPNDLFALAAVSSGVAMIRPYAHASTYVPSEWKGQLTKEACHNRIKLRLDDTELELYSDAEKRTRSVFHNAADAVGIGLHHLGRFDRKRVIAP